MTPTSADYLPYVVALSAVAAVWGVKNLIRALVAKRRRRS